MGDPKGPPDAIYGLIQDVHILLHGIAPRLVVGPNLFLAFGGAKLDCLTASTIQLARFCAALKKSSSFIYCHSERKIRNIQWKFYQLLEVPS